ncbi:LuxR family transcriptional regulator [Nocardioides coralli]|uniref:LuxR family transcriptional regulator n=1 Tax=Nocardioides coralli TaxID=2872154 RepID=UPI001CA3A46E|nr:LuxR family transcriptional regulator [Nocardioides coralli]QZY29053.1 LuxR C-terminal-related transcriptional regulator [Nocardioides coralli]
MPVTHATTSTADIVRQGRITEALEILEAHPDPDVEELALLLECRMARGEMELAVRVSERLAAAPHRTGDDERRVAMAMGELWAATGRDDDAVASFLLVGKQSVDDEDPVSLPWRASASVSLIRLGRRQEAEELAEEHLEVARADGSAYAVAGAIRTAAAVCVAADRREQLREALVLAAGHDRLVAQVATDLAGLLALTPGPASREEAVRLLRGAEDYADAEDLWPLHTRVRRLLERLGETALVPRSEAVARLSDAELRVARLAARGQTNRTIAEQLGVTVKAVEWHLSHAYRKLHVGGRTELPRVLRLS